MKCPNCGCEDFYVDQLRTGCGCTEGGAWEAIEVNRCPVVAYLCKKCGRIELYGPESLARYQAQDQERAKKEAEKLAKEKRTAFLLKEKERLEKIVNDENQTVKAVRNAKNRLEAIYKELNIKDGVYPCGN